MENNSINPWEQCPDIWKTEAEFWTYLRGVFRKGWSSYPLKLAYIKANRKRIINPSENNRKRFPECWGMTCALCGKDTVQKEIEINHKGNNCSFTGISDTEKYVSHLFMVNFSSLEPVCKSCHKIYTYSQKQGISYNESANIKYAIKIMKEENVKDILYFLESYGYNDCTSNAKRRKALEAILKEYCL